MSVSISISRAPTSWRWKLCDTADIIVENFRAGTLGFFGLDYETLSKRNPRLIYASITGYGQGGPWRSRMAYAPTVQAEAGFTENSVRHYGSALTEPRTDSLSHADVYSGLQAVIAILAALNSRQRTGRASISTSRWRRRCSPSTNAPMSIFRMMTSGAEPAVLGATDCSFFTGPQGEKFTVATSIIGSRTFPSWLRAMRRVDLLDGPRFCQRCGAPAEFRALHQIIQSWILTFPDMATLDAQFDEAKIAMGEIRSIKELTASEWSGYWGAVQRVPTAAAANIACRAGPGDFPAEELAPSARPLSRASTTRGVQRTGLSEAEFRRLSRGGVLVAHRRALEPEVAAKPEAAGAGGLISVAEGAGHTQVRLNMYGRSSVSKERCQCEAKPSCQQGMLDGARHGGRRRSLVHPDPA